MRFFADSWIVAVILAVPAAMPASAQTGGFDPYVVHGQPVSAVAENAVAAKDAAIAEGMRDAMRRVLQRVSTSEARKTLPVPDGRAVDALVDRYSIQWESIAPTGYRAALDVVFSPISIRGHLARYGFKAVDVPAPEILIIPVHVESDIPMWWGDADAWRQALEGPDFADGLTPVSFPANTRRDLEERPERILAADRVSLDTFRVRYRTHSVVVATAETTPGRQRVAVTLTGEDAAGPIDETFEVGAGGLDRAADEVARRLSDRWKAALSGTLPGGGEGGQTAVHVILHGGDGAWDEVRRRLEATGAVSGIAVESMAPLSANVVIWHEQSSDRLVAALAEHDLDLFRAGGSWLLQAY